MAHQAVKISVAIIGRDEEEVLQNCLQSVAEADEIIFVDTGSKDGTKSIASHFTDKIFDFEWCDDFSAARNFAMGKCANKWVFHIDCDETLTTPLAEVRSTAQGHDSGYFDVKITSSLSYHYYPRLVCKNEFVRWEGICHPCLNIWDGWRKSKIEVEAGRSPNHDEDPDREIRMCSRAIKISEEPRYHFYLGRVYAQKKEWDRAIDCLERFLCHPYWDFYKAETHLLMAKAYRMMGDMVQSRECAIQAWVINPDFREAADFLAFISEGREQDQWLAQRLTASNENVLFYRRHEWQS